MATFDENGNYVKTTWKGGDKITAAKLNKIEESLEAINNNDISRHVEADARLDELESGTASDKQAINAKVDALEDTVEANKDATDLEIYSINAHMTLLDKKIDDGVAEVEAIAETVDGKIDAAETNIQNQVNQGKADMEAMVAEVEADLERLHVKDEELDSQLEHIEKSSGYDVKKFGAKGDGETDDTLFIQSAIDHINNMGGGTLLLSPGVYMIDASVGVQLKSNVNILNQGGKLKAIPNDLTNSNVIYIGNTCYNNILTDLVIEGERDEHLDTEGEWGNGINIIGDCGNITFKNLTISNCWGDGIEFYRKRIGGNTYVDYIPRNFIFSGITKISNCRRQGITIGSGEYITIEHLECKDINGTLPMAALNLENEFSVDVIGDIRVNYLKADGCAKAFTMRNKAPLSGNITIGTIESEKQITENWGGYDMYIPQFRVIFECFSEEQSKYSVNVENIFTEHETVQLENIYSEYNPSVNIGNIYSKRCDYINSADPTTRGIIVFNNNLYPDIDSEIIAGNIKINNVYVDEVDVIGTRETPIRPFIVNMPTQIADRCCFDNVHINNIQVNKFNGLTTTGHYTSNIYFGNVNINSCYNKTTYTRQDGGAKTIIVQDKNEDYVLNRGTSNAEKVILLRVLEGIKEYTLHTNYNSRITVNTSYFETRYEEVIYNGLAIQNDGQGNYLIGSTSGFITFKIKGDKKQLIIESFQMI